MNRSTMWELKASFAGAELHVVTMVHMHQGRKKNFFTSMLKNQLIHHPIQCKLHRDDSKFNLQRAAYTPMNHGWCQSSSAPAPSDPRYPDDCFPSIGLSITHGLLQDKTRIQLVSSTMQQRNLTWSRRLFSVNRILDHTWSRSRSHSYSSMQCRPVQFLLLYNYIQRLEVVVASVPRVRI
jgi:hypothetical protein